MNAVRRGRKRLLALALSFVAAAATASASGESLATVLDRLVRQSCFDRAMWGVQVVACADGTVLFETNAHRLLKPASNAKLFTGALALDRFGPDFTIATDLVPAAPVNRHGVLRGDLIVYGRGDFSFAARFFEGDGRRSFDRVVEALRSAGVRRIEGALVADDSFFRGPPFGSGWTWDDLQYYYGAEVSALGCDDHVVELTFRPGAAAGMGVRMEATPATPYLEFDTGAVVTGEPGTAARVSIRRDPGGRVVVCKGRVPAGGTPVTEPVTMPEPALYFVTRLRERLVEEGIRVGEGVRHDSGARSRLKPDAERPGAMTVRSPAMSELVGRMMKASQNLYAQLLFLQAGAHESGAPAGGDSDEAGARALRRFVERAGIPSGEVLLDEGSGLSRSCLATPASFVKLLRFMDRHAQREVFLAALPVAGVDGTLRRRLGGTRAEGNVRAKTGTLRYVHTLAGFATNAVGTRLVFSVMLNAYDPPPGGPSGRDAVDNVARLLAESTETVSR